jgi:hypothetical protein
MERAKMPHLLMNGLRKCGFIKWNFTQPQRRMKFCHFAGKCIELQSIIFSGVSQTQKAKSHMFSLIWNIVLKQMQQYSETLVAQRAGHTREG